MTGTDSTVDVAVVGASLAGCTAATLLARAGVRVALLESHADPGAYKRLCGHFVQPCATPVLERLGIAERLDAAGAVRNGADVWTRWGWVAPRPAPGTERERGYSLRRSKLDPLLRALAADTPGVELRQGTTVTALLEDGGRVRGVAARDRAGTEHRIRASLVVGADGRRSTVAELAGAPVRTRPNERFCYMAYAEGVERRPDGRGWFWGLDPDVAIAVPNDDGLTLLAAFPHKRRLPEFKADRDGAFRRYMASAPGGPDLGDARIVSKLVGYTDYPIVARPPVPRPGVALVGDAALTCDPTWAIGCGWALQSAGWLADAVEAGLAGGEPLEAGLRRYARRHRRSLGGHARMLDLAARATPPSPVERLLLRAAVRDQPTARTFERFVGRTIPVRRFLAPSVLARAAWVVLRPGAAAAA